MDKKKISAIFTACIILTGCTAVSDNSSDTNIADTESTLQADTVSTKNSSGAAKEQYDNVSGCLPVIDIRTKNTDSLDFVTEPTTRHVAESKASWEAGYIIPPEPYY